MKSTETKEEIREKYRKIRAQIPSETRKHADNQIAERLFNRPEYRDARIIYCYMSFKDEADTASIIDESLRLGKQVALPRVSGKRKMEFFFISGQKDLVTGFMGIKEPAGYCLEASAPSEDALVLLPGLAFDRSGARLGYGGGFYDTYLAKHAGCKKAALAYSAQIAPEIPTEPVDVKTDMIITEKELIICSQDFREIR
ncbi:MAG TPA: 5-formyltetrahydrofolate cyclo-ligase [Candidatus Mediterraneibacter intestinigallinarum]|nr:5-formyltetrahydrofolate cyclo-ligase [Candidatus Mediterraneibacter intestinigallinarum]